MGRPLREEEKVTRGLNSLEDGFTVGKAARRSEGS